VPFPKQAMILAAGRGTRLGKLGERVAKALVEIGGEPLLAHQLRYLGAHGVERVVVNASHLAEQLEEFASLRTGSPQLQVVVEPEALGTAGGVRNALPLLAEGPLLVLYGDVVSGEDLGPMASLHARERPVATIAVFHSDRAEAKGVVDLDGSRITAFHEKDPKRSEGWVNSGIYIVETGWVAGYPAATELDFGFDLFPEALRDGRRLLAHRLAGPVLDIGTPEDLARGRERGLPPPPQPAPD
jgi:NDP-sugar pyrophosphorylase family protein